MVEKGIISSFLENEKKASVTIPSRDNYVTEYVFIADNVPTLKVGDIVAIVEFTDLTGVILTKLEDANANYN